MTRHRVRVIGGAICSIGALGAAELSHAQATSSPPRADLPVADDFADGVADGWEIVNDTDAVATWTVVDGALQQDRRVESERSFDQSYHTGTYALLRTRHALNDYRFSVDMTYVSTDLADDIGVMFRYVDADNYYRFTMNARYGFSRLEKKVRGAFVPLAVNSRGYVRGEKVRISVDVRGSHIQVLQDGEPLFAVEDTNFTTGTVALYCQDRARFDNILIEAPPDEPLVTLATPTAHSVEPGDELDVSALASNLPPGGYVEFRLDGANVIADSLPPYATRYAGLTAGDHTVEAIARDAAGAELARDTNRAVGTGGRYFVMIGDSIANGSEDNYAADNVSRNGRIVADQGAQATLTDLLEATLGIPIVVYNEAIGGDDSAESMPRVQSIMARHPASTDVLIVLGTSDSSALTPTGRGCTGRHCAGTFKGNLQTTIDAVTTAGKSVHVARVGPTFGYGEIPFDDPLKAPRNVDFIRGYNDVIEHELEGHRLGPDVFSYLLSRTVNRFSLFDDATHPNALGHRVMAYLWHNALAAPPAPMPFILSDLSRSTTAPYLKQNLLEPGDAYYVDAPFRLAAVPTAVADGVWIMTANRDARSTAKDYVSFSVDRPVTVYVAYDADARSHPRWMAAYKPTPLTVTTTNMRSPRMAILRRDCSAGRITLGGNMAAGAAGTKVNYVVIVVPLEMAAATAGGGPAECRH